MLLRKAFGVKLEVRLTQFIEGGTQFCSEELATTYMVLRPVDRFDGVESTIVEAQDREATGRGVTVDDAFVLLLG